MPELLLALGVFAVAAYAVFLHRALHPESVQTARDHYRTLARWARLLEDLRRDDLIWPVLSEEHRTEIRRELDRFYRQ
jgi:hypothetical protein